MTIAISSASLSSQAFRGSSVSRSVADFGASRYQGPAPAVLVVSTRPTLADLGTTAPRHSLRLSPTPRAVRDMATREQLRAPQVPDSLGGSHISVRQVMRWRVRHTEKSASPRCHALATRKKKRRASKLPAARSCHGGTLQRSARKVTSRAQCIHSQVRGSLARTPIRSSWQNRSR
jgi:hypothetical protein